jgi:hypothetical protein
MVHQLSKYIPVDVYGRCIPNRPWPKKAGSDQDMSDEELVSHYKFYLALENTNCEDYVTEKLWRPFAVGSVPVVDGPKDYSRFKPGRKSLVEYDDFGSPEALARFLRRLDEDDSAYEEYLSYRSKRTLANTDSQGDVRINEPETYNQDYKDRLLPWFIDNWDVDTSGSPNKTMTEWLTKGNGPSSDKTKASDIVAREKYGMQWGPDYHGGLCALCREVHDLTEGIKKLPLSISPPESSHRNDHDATIKRLGLDRTCTFRKYYYPSWIMAFYPYWSLVVVMILMVLVWVTISKRGCLVGRHGFLRVRLLGTRTLVAVGIIKRSGGREQYHHNYSELSSGSSGVV